MAIIGVLKRNTCHIEECNANPYKSTRWQDQQLENIAKDKGKTEPDGLGYLNEWTFGPEEYSDGLGYLNGWTFGLEEDFELHVGHGT